MDLEAQGSEELDLFQGQWIEWVQSTQLNLLLWEEDAEQYSIRSAHGNKKSGCQLLQPGIYLSQTQSMFGICTLDLCNMKVANIYRHIHVYM